ncbi:hypothetical protein FRC0546_00842 [Corynebacterium diphtheriae]|nr:hypothetical protein FRC0546_00842 [Corynebacterium diphtheriae]
MPKKWRPASKRGISYQKVVLHDVVPEGEYVAASAGDSPFSPGTPLAPGTLLEKPIPAWFWPRIPKEPSIPFDYTVIARTPDLLVVNKPCFLPATSNGRIVAETVASSRPPYHRHSFMLNQSRDTSRLPAAFPAQSNHQALYRPRRGPDPVRSTMDRDRTRNAQNGGRGSSSTPQALLLARWRVD